MSYKYSRVYRFGPSAFLYNQKSQNLHPKNPKPEDPAKPFKNSFKTLAEP